MPTYLANGFADARVRAAMGLPIQTRTNPLPNVARRQVLRTNPKDSKTQCVFTDGTGILVSDFLASFIRGGDELLFPVELEAADTGTQIHIHNTNPEEEGGMSFRQRSATLHNPKRTGGTTSSLPLRFAVPTWASQLSISAARRLAVRGGTTIS